MIRDFRFTAGSRPANRSPTRAKENSSPNKKDPTLRRSAIDASMLRASTSNNHSLFSFGGRNGVSGDHTAGSVDFLPSVSFDDLQSSLETASVDFKANQVSATMSQRNSLSDEQQGAPERRLSENRMAERSNVSTHTRDTSRVATQPPPATRTSRSSSILQRPSTSHRQSSSPSVVSSTSTVLNAPTAPAAMRNGRRQSHYPPVSNSYIAKPPRRSVGPGSYVGEPEPRTAQRRRPSPASRMDRSGVSSTRSSLDDGSRLIGDSTRTLPGSRAAKTRSIRPPPRVAQPSIVADSSYLNTAECNRASTAMPRSPRASLKSSSSASSKRLPMMPGHTPHASGLGARTISPTDTRRMKRMSIMPQPPSTQLPHPPPIAVDTRPSSRSPSMLPRKTSTPSSSRTTPDPNRKSYSSGLSIGSTTSYNTVRTSTGSIQPRIPQSASSRLPAPKALILNVAASAGEDEEEVPPVPAIPKVYESPKDTSQATFPDKRKSSLAVDASSIDSNSTGSLSRAQANDPSSRVLRKPGDRPSVPTNVQADEESTAPSKKRTQPLRLPPITLAPLSTPTAQKIAALHDAGPTDGYSSPVPGRKLANTPSTPMTASKSSFFSGARLDKSDQGRLRSNSTVHYGRLESPADAEATSSSESIVHPASAQDGVPRSGVSPFLSSSVPKTSRFEAAMTKRSKTGSDFTPPLDTSNVEATPLPRPSGPRPPAPKPSKAPAVASKSPPSLASTDDTPTTSSMASLRRKLSMTWKRSASKASGSLPYYDDKAINSMPPPRIPASATVGHIPSGKQGSPSPSSKSSATGTYLEARRRKSSTSSLTAMIAQDRSRIESRNGVKKEPTLDAVAERSATKAHNSSVVPKPLRPTAPVTTIRPHDVWTADLDKYDLVAEEEMKKMGARRKETELAARTLDALRKRATAKERVSAQDAIRIAALNIYERGEIVDFKDVYFCGTQNAAKVVGEVQSDLPNYGYDDERGDYTIVPGDHLAYRYEIIDVLGKGSFGQVVRCIDHKTGVLVAVKIIRNKKRFHQQALIEVKILQKLREWDPKNKHSMVNFTHSFYFRGHLCISTELLDMNLYEFIKSNAFRGFSLKLIRRFTKQMLSSLNLLKQHKVIHCDLKPENILLRHPLHSEIKVIDFGSSCFENEKVYTYIQSRFYRSPEVILGMTYGMPIDMWSLGCILAELYTGVPIFPGENEQEQLACIMEVFGPPEKHLIEKSTRKKIFFDSMGKPRLTVSSKGRRRRPSSKTLQQVLKCDDESFLDFISRCLRWDPERRIKPDEAIRHEFITGHKTSVLVARHGARDSSPAKRAAGARDLSPAKRAVGARPLPEPPGSAAKAGGTGPTLRVRADAAGGMANGTSPSKSAAGGGSRKTSGTSATPGGAGGGKRTGVASGTSGYLSGSATTSNLTMPSAFSSTSGLPRASIRSVSSKQDVAAAGALAAMSRRA